MSIHPARHARQQLLPPPLLLRQQQQKVCGAYKWHMMLVPSPLAISASAAQASNAIYHTQTGRKKFPASLWIFVNVWACHRPPQQQHIEISLHCERLLRLFIHKHLGHLITLLLLLLLLPLLPLLLPLFLPLPSPDLDPTRTTWTRDLSRNLQVNILLIQKSITINIIKITTSHVANRPSSEQKQLYDDVLH